MFLLFISIIYLSTPHLFLWFHLMVGWLVGLLGRLVCWCRDEFSIWRPLPLEVVPTVVAVR